ncbi:hypothetical protein D3226_10355 [Leucobacter chromiireducens subsp. chromiireducens]|uniref:ATPase AAA-type core domain-containing protein n=2 Tax=Leucobacter TaxID=55968 RepID=A0ABS1SQD4_9MICO|nr:hypothetical protein [Leucobacter chromiireducens subsp. chromiireducens]
MHESITAYSPPVNTTPDLLTRQDIHFGGTEADAHAWLAQGSHVGRHGYLVRGNEVNPGIVSLVISQGDGHLRELGLASTLAPNARSRFESVAPAPRRADFTDPPTHDLHYFEDDSNLREELSEHCKAIFGSGLTLDPLSGSLLFRYGQTSVEAPLISDISDEYRQDLAKLSPLDSQGDGVAATLGLLIPLLAGRTQIAFVDEPEAYLHPPQAFKLGRILASIAEKHSIQLVVATHDKNFVAGVLSAEVLEKTVVRLERSGTETTGYKVDPEQLEEVWTSPLLRHSNILDGLFHRAVVVAEDARDCLFYSAALEAAAPLENDLLPSDVLFASANGKGGIAEIARILQAAHVPVVAVMDMDAVNDKAFLKRIVESVGGSWTGSLEQNYQKATAEFRQPRKPQTNRTVNALISGVLEVAPDKIFTGETRDAVKGVLASENPWDAIKKFGLQGFKADRGAANELRQELAGSGVLLVPVGELEQLAPEVTVKKGPGWVLAALKQGAHSTPSVVSFATEISDAVSRREAALAG